MTAISSFVEWGSSDHLLQGILKEHRLSPVLAIQHLAFSWVSRNCFLLHLAMLMWGASIETDQLNVSHNALRSCKKAFSNRVSFLSLCHSSWRLNFSFVPSIMVYGKRDGPKYNHSHIKSAQFILLKCLLSSSQWSLWAILEWFHEQQDL